MTRARLLLDALAALAGVPALRLWQARRIAYGWAIAGGRPGYEVLDVTPLSRLRAAVAGREPGYTGDLLDPDLTTTLVERRGYQFWVRDPFTRAWGRWL